MGGRSVHSTQRCPFPFSRKFCSRRILRYIDLTKTIVKNSGPWTRRHHCQNQPGHPGKFQPGPAYVANLPSPLCATRSRRRSLIKREGRRRLLPAPPPARHLLQPLNTFPCGALRLVHHIIRTANLATTAQFAGTRRPAPSRGFAA